MERRKNDERINHIELREDLYDLGDMYPDGIITIAQVIVRIIRSMGSVDAKVLTKYYPVELGPLLVHRLSRCLFKQSICPFCQEEMFVEKSFTFQIFGMAMRYAIQNNCIDENLLVFPRKEDVCKELSKEKLVIYGNMICGYCGHAEKVKSAVSDDCRREANSERRDKGMYAREHRIMSIGHNMSEEESVCK